MPFAVELFFDEESEARIGALWDELRDAGLPALGGSGSDGRPHISLTGYRDADEDDVRKILVDLAANTPVFPLHIASVGTFPGDEGVVFLGPSVSRALLDIHSRTVNALESRRIPTAALYAPGRWVPHCSVAIRVDQSQISNAINICRRSDALGQVGVREIGLFEIQPARHRFAVPLRTAI